MNNTSALQGVSSGRRLLVKVVKGEGLIHAKDPFCIIEMDEPQQKNQTGARQGTNPYWDEHFLLYACVCLFYFILFHLSI